MRDSVRNFDSHGSTCTCSKCLQSPRVSPRGSSTSFLLPPALPDLSTVERSTLATVASLQAQKIDVVQKQASILSQSLLGVSASWYNASELFTEEGARVLLDYLHPCRQVCPEIEELFRAVYYSSGSPLGPRRRLAPVPPPSFEVAPPPFSAPTGAAPSDRTTPSESAPSSHVVRQGDYWRATVSHSDGITSTQAADGLRHFLGERVFHITVRRLDVFLSGGSPRQLTVCCFDSDDPSAKTASGCLRDLCDLLNEAAVTVAPFGTLQGLAEIIKLETWKFVGIAADFAQLYRETKGFRGEIQGERKNAGWKRTMETTGSSHK